jgi:hypothetical protein
MGKMSGSGSRIRIWDEKPGSYFQELRNHFLELKYLNSLMQIRNPGSRVEKIWIRNPEWKKFESVKLRLVRK